MFSGQAASRFLCVLGSQFQICRSNPDRPTLGSVYSPDPISHGQGMGLLSTNAAAPSGGWMFSYQGRHRGWADTPNVFYHSHRSNTKCLIGGPAFWALRGDWWDEARWSWLKSQTLRDTGELKGWHMEGGLVLCGPLSQKQGQWVPIAGKRVLALCKELPDA